MTMFSFPQMDTRLSYKPLFWSNNESFLQKFNVYNGNAKVRKHEMFTKVIILRDKVKF